MENSVYQKINRLKKRAKSRPSTFYPEPFKKDAIAVVQELRDMGWTKNAISQAFEIPWCTFRSWLNLYVEAEKPAQNFRPVEIVDALASPVLMSPAGWRIEGLSLEQLKDLVNEPRR